MNQKEAAQNKMEIARAYRGLFLTEVGDLKPEAEVILRDLEKVCGWMVGPLPTAPDGHVDPLRLAAVHEKRTVYAHIKKRLFEPLERYKRQIEGE